jgi:hypothetical protein
MTGMIFHFMPKGTLEGSLLRDFFQQAFGLPSKLENVPSMTGFLCKEDIKSRKQEKLMHTHHQEDDPGTEPQAKVISPIINEWIAAFNAHNAEQILTLYTKDAELFDSGMKYARRGHQEIFTWFVQRFQQMPTLEYTPLQRFFNERGATIHWMIQGQTPPLFGQRRLIRPFQVDGVSVIHIEHNLISWQHGYYDHLQIIEQAIPFFKWFPLRL